MENQVATFTLIENKDRQRYYRSSLPLFRNRYGNIKVSYDAGGILDDCILKDGMDNDRVYVVCVSDAVTHIERLVFPAAEMINKSTGESVGCIITDYCEIEGYMSPMINRVDYSLVKPDDAYLKLLCIHSGYEFGGVEESVSVAE